MHPWHFGMVEHLSPNTSWYLITSDEIDLIRIGLQDIRDSQDNDDRVQEIPAVVNAVRDRLA